MNGKDDRKIISLEISADMRKKLKLAAYDHDMSLSAMVRQMIAWGLERVGKEARK